jgi:hypothetical protein
MEKLEIGPGSNYDSSGMGPSIAPAGSCVVPNPMGRKLIATAAIAAILLLSICPFLGAQQADRPARVFVSVSAGPSGDPAYRSLLSDALIVTFARSRMKASAWDSADAARAAARRDGADYLVLGTWGNTTESLELVVEAWLPDGSAPLASGKASGKIGLSLDAVAADALSLVLPVMSARFPADAATTTGSEGAVVVQAVGTTEGTTGTSTGTVTAVGPSVGDVTAVHPPSRWRRVELSLGGAPLVATGDLADYAKLGAFSTLDLDVRFAAGRGVVSAGLLAGAGWFRAEGVGVADILVLPAGPDVHWTLSADANPTVSLHAAAGPAVLVAFIGGAGSLAKVSPFVSGGLGVDIALAPAFGLRLDADYLVVFEGSMVLQGFTPRLSLRTRF